MKKLDYLSELNPNQKKAVCSAAKYLRIVAGAGSGKTRVLTTRIAYLIAELKVEADKILAITFTNKAAKEMKQRVELMFDQLKTMPHISTIHSFCVSVLRRDITYLGYPRNFTIIDTNDQRAILKEAYKKLNIDAKELKYSTVLNYIASNKAAKILPKEALAKAYTFEEEKAKVYEFYDNKQRQLMALDFDDLLLWTEKLFLDFVPVLQKWQRKYAVILVDEFQDVDHIQYNIIKLLVGDNSALAVVGDPDQTIYTWRGADVNIIMNLKKDFANLETVVLDTNYRSSKNILAAANKLIANNKNRIEKDLIAHNKDSEAIVYYGAMDEENEAIFIAMNIKELIRTQEINYGDIAILYRANYISRAIEKILASYNIPYTLVGGLRFYERKEIKDILSYLRLLITGDDLAFRRVINVPSRKIGDKTIEAIDKIAMASKKNLYDVLSDCSSFTPTNQKKLSSFYNLIESLKSDLDKYSLIDLMQRVLEKTGYKEMLIADKEMERLENIKELISDVEAFLDSYPEATLIDYLQMVSLYTDKSSDYQGEFVTMMSVHSAKGLEFDTVFVAGMNEGVFPSERSLQESGIKGLEEERRLAYVAYTRAKNRLFISESKGYSYVLAKAKTASRFIEEIGKENLLLKGNVDHSLKNSNNISTNRSANGALVKPQINKVNNNGRNNKYLVNDKVEHEAFGVGLVIKNHGSFIEIAFNYPHGIKKISTSFAGIRKV
ncbi:MAG: ATP-dependent helicase [Erysipelotrichaceae bacterium]